MKERHDPVSVVNQMQVFDDHQQRLGSSLRGSPSSKTKDSASSLGAVALDDSVIPCRRSASSVGPLQTERRNQIAAEDAQFSVGRIDLVPADGSRGAARKVRRERGFSRARAAIDDSRLVIRQVVRQQIEQARSRSARCFVGNRDLVVDEIFVFAHDFRSYPPPSGPDRLAQTGGRRLMGIIRNGLEESLRIQILESGLQYCDSSLDKRPLFKPLAVVRIAKLQA